MCRSLVELSRVSGFVKVGLFLVFPSLLVRTALGVSSEGLLILASQALDVLVVPRSKSVSSQAGSVLQA